MRILFLTDSLSDLDGVGRYTNRLIHALEELRPGLEVEVLLARKHRPTSSTVPARWLVTVGLPPDYFYYMTRARFWASFASAVWRVRARARRADLVHAIKDYPHNFAGLVGARLARKPCVATAHGTYSVQPFASKRHAPLARWSYTRFSALISVSRYTQTRLQSLIGAKELDRARMHVIQNAVSAEHYATPRALSPRPWHAHAFTLGIGEVKERKGHHLSLGAFCAIAARHPHLHHYVVGNAVGDAYHERLLAMARAAGVEVRVHFLGNVTEDEKVDLLQRAQVFVHTPVTAADGGFEGFGLVYLEASACGIPVIGTRDCGAEDAIDDGETGFLVDQDVESVARALEMLVLDADLRRSLGARGLLRARRSTWLENAQAVLAIYDEAVREGAR